MAARLPTGKLARGAIGSLALAHAGAARLGHRARQLTRDAGEQDAARAAHEAHLGRILFRALNQLKGTALKVSQLLSMEGGLLPEGVRRELAKACYQVTPLNRALVHKVFRQEFGQAPEQLFARFEPASFAAASLGQVHGAELADGRAVAVKVQYPGIAASISSDLRLLRGILDGMGGGSGLLPSKEIIARTMGEIEHRLAAEIDYVREAEQLRWFGQHVVLPGVVVPQPVAGYSGARVLTMERLDGLHLDEWLATSPDQALRDHYGQLLFDWFLSSVFELRRLNADPHPGNFLFMPDGRLGVLDFGCVKALSPAFCDAMAQAWQASLRPGGDSVALRDIYLRLGMISDALGQAEFDAQLMPALAGVHGWQLAPFRTASFDFAGMPPYPAGEREHVRTLFRLLTAIPDDLPYFDRAFLGLMHLLKKIGARVVTRNRWIY